MTAPRLLHIDSSITGAHSVSRTLAASVVDKLRDATPGLQVTYRDLTASPLPHLTGAVFAAASSGQMPQDEALCADLTLGSEVLDEFLAADIVVLGVGFYNFGIPSQLKAWVDRIAVRGKTFQYTERGPVGLVRGKRVVIAIARGGYYGPGSPAAAFEHAETYLRNVFAFIGIANVDVVAAEGLGAGPDARQAGIAKARATIEALPA
ncbi:MAG TPA: FMN-dependent NADH-azoreductase [Burkholderiaceae bacterium]|nr:FMN-dependent NADH-azoreductase [Burkholderiaceae bacterium]